MKDPSDFNPTIPMGIRASTRGEQFAIVQRTFLAQLGGVIMRVSQDVPYCHRQLLQQLGSDHVIGVTGDGELGGQRNPDTANHDRQMQLPAVPPAVIPRLAPGRFGINRGMRDFPCQSMFLVPDTPVGTQGGTVDSRRVSLHSPRLQQLDQMTAQTPDQGGQPRWQGRKASFPGAPRRKTPMLRQQGTNPRSEEHTSELQSPM